MEQKKNTLFLLYHCVPSAWHLTNGLKLILLNECSYSFCIRRGVRGKKYVSIFYRPCTVRTAFMLFDFISISSVFICLYLNTVTYGKQLTVGDARKDSALENFKSYWGCEHMPTGCAHTYTPRLSTQRKIINVLNTLISKYLNSHTCSRNGKMRGHCGCGVFNGVTAFNLSVAWILICLETGNWLDTLHISATWRTGELFRMIHLWPFKKGCTTIFISHLIQLIMEWALGLHSASVISRASACPECISAQIRERCPLLNKIG